MNRIIICLLGLITAGCIPAITPPAPTTIPDPMTYLAQSRGTNGDPATPLRADDPQIYQRFDFGHVQSSASFLTGPTSAITTWSYAPWRGYTPENGDGGESYELTGDRVMITHTKHLGIPTTPIAWTALTTTTTVDCAQGWTAYSPLERGCRTTVTYPALGPALTVISEHRHPTEPILERIFLAKGWGRLAWQTFRAPPTTPAPPARCPDFGWNAPTTPDLPTLTDCRYTTDVEPATPPLLTGAQLWHP